MTDLNRWGCSLNNQFQDFFNAVERLSLLIYREMELSGDWGEAGEQAAKVSFCSQLLELTPDHHLDGHDADRFYRILDEKMLQYGVSDLDLEAVKAAIKTVSFQWEGQNYQIEELDRLSGVFQSSGLPYVVQGGFYGKTLEMILGTGVERECGDLKVTMIETELMRTPTVFLPIAAMISHKHVYIRDVALHTIFHQKWMRFLRGDVDHAGLPAVVLSSWIKSQANVAYGGTMQDQESLFVSDMKQNVLDHELGHAVIQHHLLSPMAATIGEGSKMFGAQIMLDLLELLAELAPVQGENAGPLWRLVALSKIDLAAAERRFWIYWSDAWFFDTPDTYMYGYSKRFSAVLAAALDGDRVDFERLELVLRQVLPLALAEVEAMALELDGIIRSAAYLWEGQSLSLDDFLVVKKEAELPPQAVLETPYLLQSWEYSKSIEHLLGQTMESGRLWEVLKVFEARVYDLFQDHVLTLIDKDSKAGAFLGFL